MSASLRFRGGVAVLLFFGSALSFLDRQVLSVLAPTILEELSMSNVDYARVVAAFTLSYGVMFTFGGRAIDALGVRLGMALAVGLFSAVSLVHGLVAGVVSLAVARFALGAAEGGVFPGAAKAVAEIFPDRERGLAMAVAATGGSAVGAVAAPPLVVWIAQQSGWRGAFFVTGLLGGLWVVAWTLAWRGSSAPASGSTSSAERPALVPFKRLLADPVVRGVAVARFFFDPVFYFYMFWIPPYLSQQRAASLEEIARVAWIPFFLLGVSSLAAGLLSDAFVRRGASPADARLRIMTAAAFCTPLSILSVYAADSASAMLWMGSLMFAHGFWMTNYMALFADLFEARSVAVIVGLTGTAGGLGGFLFNAAAGSVVDRFGFTPLFVACGLAYPVALWLVRRACRRASGSLEARA